MNQRIFFKFIALVVGANIFVYIGYSFHTCPNAKEAKESKISNVAHELIPRKTAVAPPIHETVSPPGEAKVFRWNGSTWKRQVGFCSGNYPFKLVTLHTPNGLLPMYVHELSKDKWVSGSLANSGTWDYNNVMLTVNRLNAQPGSMFLDVGAQLGTFSLSVAKTGRHVVAVDPLLENVLRFCKSVQDGNLTHLVTILYVAVSDSRGVVSFNSPPDNNGGTEVIKVSRPPDVNDPKVMETVLLDDVIPFITTESVVVKMDVETHEYQALSGGREFLRKFSSPDILMEWLYYRRTDEAAARMMKLMAEHNYTATNNGGNADQVLDPGNFKNWPADVLWTRKGK